MCCWHKSTAREAVVVLNPHYHRIFSTGNPLFDRLTIIRETRTYLTVAPSPLVAVMIEGGLSEVMRADGMSLLLLAGVFSYDPDEPSSRVVRPQHTRNHRKRLVQQSSTVT